MLLDGLLGEDTWNSLKVFLKQFIVKGNPVVRAGSDDGGVTVDEPQDQEWNGAFRAFCLNSVPHQPWSFLIVGGSRGFIDSTYWTHERRLSLPKPGFKRAPAERKVCPCRLKMLCLRACRLPFLGVRPLSSSPFPSSLQKEQPIHLWLLDSCGYWKTLTHLLRPSLPHSMQIAALPTYHCGWDLGRHTSLYTIMVLVEFQYTCWERIHLHRICRGLSEVAYHCTDREASARRM